VITTSGIYPWSFVTSSMKIGLDCVVITTSGIYPWSFVTSSMKIGLDCDYDKWNISMVICHVIHEDRTGL
jgi:hypothetical protein